jgi:hypothetical protein
MINLNDINLSFLMTSPEVVGLSQLENNHRNNMFLNMLYSMNYSILPIYAYTTGIYEKNYLGVCSEDNAKLRQEAIFMMNQFGKNDIIVKYKGQNLLTKILKDGNEIPIEVNYYDNNEGRKTYIHEGISFTLNEKKRYFFPSKKEDLKSGMMIEYFNNNMWYQKKVDNLDTEYEKMYKLLMKYEKLRVCY